MPRFFRSPVGCTKSRTYVEAQVPADVAVELAVVGVAGVAVLGAPDLHRRLGVAAEGGRPAGREDGRVDAVARARRGVGDAVGVDEEEAQPLLGEQLVEAGVVAALGQPDAGRVARRSGAGGWRRGHRDLGPHRLRVHLHQRQEAVGGAAGDELEAARLLQAAEGGHQVAVVALDEERRAARANSCLVVERQRRGRWGRRACGGPPCRRQLAAASPAASRTALMSRSSRSMATSGGDMVSEMRKGTSSSVAWSKHPQAAGGRSR